MRWSERRTAVRSTFEMSSTLPARVTRPRPPSLILFSLGRMTNFPNNSKKLVEPPQDAQRILPQDSLPTATQQT
jgi:hypothetical protein